MDLSQSNPKAQREAAALWKKGANKIKMIMAMKVTTGKNRTRSIFGNQFNKGDLLEDMPEIYLERREAQDDPEDLVTARSDTSGIAGWSADDNNNNTNTNHAHETIHTHDVGDDVALDIAAAQSAKKYAGKGYKTNVRASILKMKSAAKKVSRYINVVRLAHDPLKKSTLSYDEVVEKLRSHYDPDGIHSNKHADQHEYYTDLGLLKRESLKHHPKIRGLLDQLWEASDKNGDGGLDKEEYMIMCRKVYKAIVDDSDDVDDEEERERIAQEDWIADSYGHDTLNYRRFTTAWFQLADHWTHDLSVDAYCSFLGEIKDHVTITDEFGRIVWKDDSDIQHMIHVDEEHEEEEKVEPEPEPEVKEEIIIKVVKKIKPKPKKIYKAPVITKPKEKKEAPQISSMVLQEGNPNDKRRNIARMYSRNGLYTGSTVPPPRGWDAKKSNQWGITFTRIKMESQAREQEASKSSMNVRASLSLSPRRPLSPPPHITGAFSPNNSASSSFDFMSHNRHEAAIIRPSSAYLPSASAGFQANKFRYPQAYDAMVGTTGAGGGFEWSNPIGDEADSIVEGGNGSRSGTGGSGNGSELLRPIWNHNEQKRHRPSTAGGNMPTSFPSSAGDRNNNNNDVDMFRSPWNDQLARPSTASGYLSSQATLTLVPMSSTAEILQAASLTSTSTSQLLDGNGGSSLLKSTNSMGSMMLDYIQSPVVRKRRRKKKKSSYNDRPKTAPGKPREHRFDRLDPTERKTSSKRSMSPSDQRKREGGGGRRRRRNKRSNSPTNGREEEEQEEGKEQEGGGRKEQKHIAKVTRMRKRVGPSKLLSPAGIPSPIGALEPLIRPMTTGGIRRKKKSSNRPVRVNASNSLFRPSSSHSMMSTSSVMSASPSSILLSSGDEGTMYDNEEYGGSRILDPTDMRGLPSSARALMNQYVGYDPLASLNEASMSIVGGSSIFSSPIKKGRRGRKKRRNRQGRKAKKNKNGGIRSNTSSMTGNINGGSSSFGSMSMSAYMNKLVMPASKKTIRLLKLQESCTIEDIVGVMLAVGVNVAPMDVTLSDVSSKTRLRHASVRFGKYKDYKLALRMLEICNRTENQQKSSKCAAVKKNTRKRRNGSSDVVTNVLWGGDSSDGKNELEKDFDCFGPTRLIPVSKLKIPRSLQQMML